MRGNKKKNKPKAKFGTFLTENADALGVGASMAGQITDAVLPKGSIGGGAASGALKGAGALAALGPIGMGVGAVGGALLGGIQAKKAQNAEADAEKARQKMITQNLVGNAGNAFEHGGSLASKLNVMNGGDLKKISKDAVEVDAHEPGKTDSVELESAFVDHNEVIDNKNRVFSDSVFLPNGKSVAKEAKSLEKMKSKSARFAKSNEMIDNKINSLFEYQESSKKEGMTRGGKMKLREGGEVDPPGDGKRAKGMEPVGNITKRPYRDPVVYTKQQYLDNQIPENHARARYFFETSPATTAVTIGTDINAGNEWINSLVSYETAGEKSRGTDLYGRPAASDTKGQLPSTEIPYLETMAKKKGLKGGGKLKPKYVNGTPSLFGDDEEELRASYGSSAPPVQTAAKVRKGITKEQGQKAMTGLATFGPNVVNTFLQKKLQGPATPALEQKARLKRIDPTAQLTELSGDYRLAAEAIGRGTAQGSALGSNVGNLMAKKMGATNQAMGQVNALNAQTQNQEAFLNQQTGARNIERQNLYTQGLGDLANKKLQLSSENLANLSGKVLLQGRERNEMALDKERYQILKEQFGDSGVLSRLEKRLADKVDFSKYGSEKEGVAKGGKIHIKKSKVGSLHKHLGIPKDKKIPASKLAIKESDSPAIKKKKVFAKNARKWKH